MLGPYEIVSPLGAGGMGEVYRARDTRLGRTVAIKLTLNDNPHDPHARLQFQREGRAIAALNHPRICAVHDVGRHDVHDYMVMEYLDGETVEARTGRIGRYMTASTRPALLNRIAGRLLFGPAGSTAKLKVQKLDGGIREVSLVRDSKKTLPPEEKGDVVRILPGNLGYADLTRLSRAEVDGMFDKLKDTRAIVFSSGASTMFTKSKWPSVAHWAFTVAPSTFASALMVRLPSSGSPLASSWKAPLRDSFGNGIAPQLGGADGLSVSIHIWKSVVSSSSRLYSAWVTPVPALITWTSPAAVRPLLPIESWCVIAPVRT